MLERHSMKLKSIYPTARPLCDAKKTKRAILAKHNPLPATSCGRKVLILCNHEKLRRFYSGHDPCQKTWEPGRLFPKQNFEPGRPREEMLVALGTSDNCLYSQALFSPVHQPRSIKKKTHSCHTHACTNSTSNNNMIESTTAATKGQWHA